MGKPKKPKLPPAPSAGEIIGAQAQANRINQTTPYGNVAFTGPNRSNLEFSLSPQFQALLDSQTGFGQQAAQRGSEFLGATQFNPATAQDVGAIGQGIFDLGASRALPVFARQQQQLQERLEQSGNPAYGADLSPGTVSELDVLGRQRNEFLSDLALQSVIGATAQRGQLLQQDVAQNQGNAQLAALLGNASPVQAPGLNSFIAPGALDVTGAYGTSQNAALQRAQLQQQERSGFLGGLFDLGTAALSFVPGMGSVSSLFKGGRAADPMGLSRYGVF